MMNILKKLFFGPTDEELRAKALAEYHSWLKEQKIQTYKVVVSYKDVFNSLQYYTKNFKTTFSFNYWGGIMGHSFSTSHPANQIEWFRDETLTRGLGISESIIPAHRIYEIKITEVV